MTSHSSTPHREGLVETLTARVLRPDDSNAGTLVEKVPAVCRKA